MRILLIQAISAPAGGELVFPLGLARLAAACQAEHEVLGLDLNLNPFPWPELVATLTDFRPDIVAISCRNLDPLAGQLVSFVPPLVNLVGLVKEYAPEAKVILGGSAFTLVTSRLLAEVPGVDLAVAGEADEIWPRLLADPEQAATLPGVWRRQADGSFVSQGGVRHCQDLDSLPWPAWEVFNPRRYLEVNRYVAFMGVETKRGCANRCRYCLYPVLQGRWVRLRHPARVVDEIAWLQQEYGIEQIHFTDPVVNQPAEHLRAVCLELKRRGVQIGWTGFFREDTLTAADLDLYRETGLLTLYFSADGASDPALDLLAKDLTREQILTAARLAAASGVLTVYHFLVNLPGENQQTVHQTRELLARLFELHAATGNLGAVVLNNLRLYPGAPLTAEIIRRGLLDPRHDLLYPTYYNPPPWDHLRYELTAWCLRQGTRLYLNPAGPPAVAEGSYAHSPA